MLLMTNLALAFMEAGPRKIHLLWHATTNMVESLLSTMMKACLLNTPRALSYPEKPPNHRTSNFAEHHMAPVAIGNFAAEGQDNLIRIVEEDNVLALGENRQCAYRFEESEGQLLMVLMPYGTFNVYEVAPDWKLLMSQ
jgi:hypothetical protein